MLDGPYGGPLHIWVLAGQSNMAGRGSTSGLPPDYHNHPCLPVAVYDGDGRWITPATDPIHRDVDLRKTDRCGVGPGIPFARAMLAAADPNIPADRLMRIGLVPCALGGTSLREWSPDFEMGSLPSLVIDPSYLARQQSSRNPFHALLTRTRACLAAAPTGSVLRGLLWYQGETDAMDVNDSASYTSRFASWASALREELGAVPILVVAVTGATAKLMHLRALRDDIFKIPEVVAETVVVDAFGLPQHEDGLHLNTQAQLELGRRMALAWRERFGPGKPLPPTDSHEATASITHLPEELRSRTEHRQLWTWADHQTREAYLAVQRVQQEHERRQAIFREGINKVEMEMTRLLRTLREREEVLSQLSDAPGGLPSGNQTGLSEDPGPPLQVSTQQHELLLLPDEDQQPPPMALPAQTIVRPPAEPPAAPSYSSLLDQDLLLRARLLSQNVERVLQASAQHEEDEEEEDGASTAPPDHVSAVCSQQEQERVVSSPPPLLSASPAAPPEHTTNSTAGDDASTSAVAPVVVSSAPSSCNFVYGEVDMLSFLHLLKVVVTDQTIRGRSHSGDGGSGRRGVFVDLGSGEGKTLLVAASSGLFERVCGVELLPGMVETSRVLAAILLEQQVEAEGMAEIEVVEGDLFQVDWSAATVLYMCATCFQSEQMAALAHKVSSLVPGSRIILLDKPFPQPLPRDLRLLMRSQCLVSWGTAAAYVYETMVSVD